MRFATTVLLTGAFLAGLRNVPADELVVKPGQSIQEKLDAVPGHMVYLSPGIHEISEKIVIRSDDSGLHGPGRIVHKNPAAPFIEVEDRTRVQLRDITLIRPKSLQESDVEAINVRRCRDLVLDNVTVRNHRTRSGVVFLQDCHNATIRDCSISNYMKITVDDRTKSTDWGYAFRCIDGSGIVVRSSRGTRIQGNRIVEHELLPTPQIQERYQLGQFVATSEQKGQLTSEATWQRRAVDNWHQGSAVIVTSPEESRQTQILNNTIENAAQGIDLHCDHVIVSGNVVSNCFVGMKAMHGSRHVLIIGNQFVRNDLWSIGLMPGAASHVAANAGDDQAVKSDNSDGASVIANNIISEFGHGAAHWVWGVRGNPILLDSGQKPENRPLSDVIIQGNIVHNSDRHHADSTQREPRYVYAIRIDPKATGIHVANNIFDPGRDGVSNVPLQP